MRIVNATLIANGTTIISAPGARTEVGNSILAKRAPDPADQSPRCDGPVASLGHNLIDDASCGLAAEGDLIDPDPGLLPLQLRFDRQEFKVPVYVPSPGSAALDSADPALCPLRDLLFQPRPIDSDRDGVPECERGAIEAIHVALTDGGANGLYFVPEHDGHYVYVLDNDFNTLVIWNTFDRNGNQAWILATGELLDGRFLDADAYINLDGVLTDAGPVAIDRARPWGRIRVALENCERGSVRFDSDRPEFGSGEFAVVRLAVVRQLGCLND